MPTAPPFGVGGETARSVWIETNPFPPDRLTVTFFTAQHLAAVAVAQPAELGQEDAAIALIELDLLRVGIAEAVGLAFLLEARAVGPGPLQVLERLLQRVNGSVRQPRRFRPIAPLGEQLAQAGVTELLLALPVAILLQRQRRVVDEAARARAAAHLALLLAGRHQFVFEGLEAPHAHSIVWSIER